MRVVDHVKAKPQKLWTQQRFIRHCTDKVTYPSEAAAISATHWVRLRYGLIQYPYRCIHCGQWHLTSRLHR